MNLLKVCKKLFGEKNSFVLKELNKYNSNNIGNAFQSQMHWKKDYYDYDRLYYNMLDHKLAKQKKEIPAEKTKAKEAKKDEKPKEASNEKPKETKERAKK
jgi:hypothetical protein